jgi:hypothetical protein
VALDGLTLMLKNTIFDLEILKKIHRYTFNMEKVYLEAQRC